jgi:cytochrome d ubiquinol oxidase subunit II
MNTPFVLFLVFIIFRAVSIEFRSKEPMDWWRKSWDVAYSVSSIALAFLLGVVLGNVLHGIPLNENFIYQGNGFLDFLHPFSILTGLTTLSLFMTHGGIYLLLKTEGRLYAKLTRLLPRGIIFFVVSFSITTLYALVYIPHLSDQFKENPVLFLVPLAAILSVANIPRLAHLRRYRGAFVFSSLTISLLLILVSIEIFPVLLFSTLDPAHSITIYNAASSTKSLGIMLTIVAIGAPLVAFYTIFVYRTFRGKVKLDDFSY